MAQSHFTYGGMGLGGIYQTVTVTLGTRLRFSAFMETWQCYDYGVACDWGRKSDQPSDMHTRIGIDPTGGTDPNSAAIVWSPEKAAFDQWVEFSVIAQAQSNKVTVFTQCGPTFDWARKNNDCYIDDLALVSLDPVPPTPTPTVTNTPTPTKTPTITPTARPTVTPGATWTPIPGITLTCQLTLTQRVYVLLPPNAGPAWITATAPILAQLGWSIGYSAVDACLNSCGGRVTLAVNAQDWGCNLAKACVPSCGNSAYVPLSAETPQDLALALERYPAWLHEAKVFGLCLPLMMRP
jgi:hypothetical protein